MRGSKTKNSDKAKVIKSKIKNPDITLWEIQEKTWVNYETARKIIKEDLPEVVKSSEIIASIIENDLASVKNMSLITKRFTEETLAKETLDRWDISVANSTVESAFKRSQLLNWWATERIESIWESQADIIARRYIKLQEQWTKTN